MDNHAIISQPNTKAVRANQRASAANRLLSRRLEDQRKLSPGGGSPSGKDDHNPYSDDGSEHKTRKKRTQTYHDQILDSWSNVDEEHSSGDEEQPTAANMRNWRKSLFETTGRGNRTNFLHSLLPALQGGIPHDAKVWLESLVLEKPDLLASANELNILPIDQAAKMLPDLLFLVFDLVLPETTRKILEAHDADTPPCAACPLWDVSTALRNFRPLREETCNNDDEAFDTFADGITASEAQEDVQAQPCLHSEVDIENLLDREKELRNTLIGVLEIPGMALGVLESLLDEARFDTEQENAQAIKLQSFRNILKLSPDDTFTTATKSDGCNLLQLAVGLFEKNSIDFDLQFKVIEALVHRSPPSIFFEYKTRDGVQKNVYHCLKELGKSAEPQRVEDVRTLIKIECIRYGGEDLGPRDPYKLQAMKRSLLYGHGETGKKLFLNLTGESAIIDEIYVDMITRKSGMQLETVLEFVRLPNWKPEGAELYRSKIEQHSESDTLCPFPDPYIGIFNWLWDKCKVRKIMALEVDDGGPEPHTDAAIRAALQGPSQERDFGIEVWKWQKFDMHAGTIVGAVPRAREVHLYSSGNIAVLQGWSCESGLAKLTELEQIIVNIYPKNSRDQEDCVSYEPIFKGRLAKHCPRIKESDIKVTYPDQSGADGLENSLIVAGTAGPVPTLSSARPKREEWIEELKAYKQFITNFGEALTVEGRDSAPRVKVAILDDGARLADLNGVQNGWSFRADSQEYFVGPCMHGTEMAVCVRDICSVAELYIARLDDSKVSEKTQAFTISSCAKALRWALDLGADVISMSWTYEMRHDNKDPDKAEFESLVKEAVDSHKAVLFGSLPDLGPNKDASSRSPVGLANVIKISSATRAGNVVEENVHQFSDFLLPGNDFENSRGELVRGSSFATAYAAGLAALVLYSLRVLDAYRYVDDDLARKALRVAKSPAGMKGIFERLAPETGGVSSNVGRFVRPSGVLNAPDSSNVSAESKTARLRDIVNNLVPDSLIKRVFPGGVPQD